MVARQPAASKETIDVQGTRGDDRRDACRGVAPPGTGSPDAEAGSEASPASGTRHG